MNRSSEGSRRSPVFATTRWSVVLEAGDDRNPEAEEALEVLCGAYWYPLYAYTRRQGYDAPAAADLTQAFFARFLEKEYLKSVDPEKGRFRAFLLACMRHFLSNERVNCIRKIKDFVLKSLILLHAPLGSIIFVSCESTRRAGKNSLGNVT